MVAVAAAASAAAQAAAPAAPGTFWQNSGTPGLRYPSGLSELRSDISAVITAQSTCTPRPTVLAAETDVFSSISGRTDLKISLSEAKFHEGS